MAGSLGGVGPQTQVPIASPLQQAANNAQGVRQEDDVRAQQDVVQPQGAEAAEVQTAATEDQQTSRTIVNEAAAFEVSGNEERGSLVDVLV